MKLNPSQEEAVHYYKGPCLVLAGAGSGKTRVITNKIINLIENENFDARSICAVTFTNKAAIEMQERVALEIGNDIAKKIWISTFHSLGLNILRVECKKLNLSPNFSLFDDYDQQKIIKDILKESFGDYVKKLESEKQTISNILEVNSQYKNSFEELEDLTDSLTVVNIIKKYNEFVRSCNAVDFDDLIYLPTKLMLENEEVYNTWSSRFRHILVDEYQDTNETQYQLLKILVKKHRSFTVVGDDDQSIYSWRGARPENINDLSREYSDLKVIKLEDNYRSTKEILECANKVISNNPHIFNKSLRSNIGSGPKAIVCQCNNENEEALFITSTIHELLFQNRTMPYSHIAILYRSNFQAKIIEKALNQGKIPSTVTGGSSFFSLSEIKDILSWCRLVINPHDNTALIRIINVPKKGIGPETIAKLSDVATKLNTSLCNAATTPEFIDSITDHQSQCVKSFVKVIYTLRQMYIKKDDIQLARNLISIVDYNRHLKANYDNRVYEIKLKNVRTLHNWILEYVEGNKMQKGVSFKSAIERLGLREMMDRENNNEDVDAVQLMTLHAAKGLEFPIVFMIGCEENILPHKNSLESDHKNHTTIGVEEERRLAYVGITRAQHKLYMTYCRERRSGENISKNEVSRFIDELPYKYINRVSYKKREPKSEDENKTVFCLENALSTIQGITRKM